MGKERPELRLIDTQTGEIVEHDERDLLIEQLTRDLHGKQVVIAKMRRELSELRAVEPEAQVVREVLEYWRDLCKPRATIAPGGKRWEKVRARLADKLDDRPPWTAGELKMAVDGALLDPWLNGTARGSKGYLDAETIFRDPEQIEKLRDLAVGFKAQVRVGVGDLAGALSFANLPMLLAVCTCDHRRLEHAKGDPDHGGAERCFMCACEDFDTDYTHPFNYRRL